MSEQYSVFAPENMFGNEGGNSWSWMNGEAIEPLFPEVAAASALANLQDEVSTANLVGPNLEKHPLSWNWNMRVASKRLRDDKWKSGMPDTCIWTSTYCIRIVLDVLPTVKREDIAQACTGLDVEMIVVSTSQSVPGGFNALRFSHTHDPSTSQDRASRLAIDFNVRFKVHSFGIQHRFGLPDVPFFKLRFRLPTWGVLLYTSTFRILARGPKVVDSMPDWEAYAKRIKVSEGRHIPFTMDQLEQFARDPRKVALEERRMIFLCLRDVLRRAQCEMKSTAEDENQTTL